MVLTIFSCKQDDIQEVDFNSLQNQKEKINHFTIEDLPDIEQALNNIGSSRTERVMTTTFGDLDLSDIIQFVNDDGKETYSFKILNSSTTQSQLDFENLHLIKLPEDNGYLAYIIQWQPNPEWYINNSYMFNLETFTGFMNRYDLDYNQLDFKEYENGMIINNEEESNRTMDYDCDVLQYTVCVDTDNCTCSPDDCYDVIEITCSSGGGDGGDLPDPIPGEGEEGGTGTHVPGGSTPGGTNTGGYVPGGNGTVVTIPPNPSEVFNSMDGITLTLQQAVWVNKENNEEKVAEILDFILEHCQTGVVTDFTCDEAKELIPLVLELFILDKDIDLLDIIYVIENEQDYTDWMSDDEKNLFDTLTRTEQLLYLTSAKQARDKTDDLYLTFCEKYNGKGDAFRHAYWNALSSSRIGVGLTNLLTTRHENQPPDYPYHWKENEMDLFNNQIGRDIVANGSTNILQDVIQALTNGDLKYLNNQDPIECKATFNSQLIPTNL